MRYRNKDPLTQARLKTIFHYSPETGLFTRAVKTGPNGAIGDVAKSNRRGRVVIRIDGLNYFGHRLAWLYMTGDWPAIDVDHRDRDPANNVWSNLRDVSGKQNAENSVEQRNNTSGHRGVSWHLPTKKWQAFIKHHQRQVHLGLFATREDAVEFRRLAEDLVFTHPPAA